MGAIIPIAAGVATMLGGSAILGNQQRIDSENLARKATKAQSKANKKIARMNLASKKADWSTPYERTWYEKPDPKRPETWIMHSEKTGLEEQERDQAYQQQLKWQEEFARRMSAQRAEEEENIEQRRQARRQEIEQREAARLEEKKAGQSRYEKMIYDQYQRDYLPKYEQEEEKLKSALNSRGIPIGSRIYQQQIDALKRNHDERLQRAATEAMKYGEEVESNELNRLGSRMGLEDKTAQTLFENAAVGKEQASGREARTLGQILSSFKDIGTAPTDSGLNAPFADYSPYYQSANDLQKKKWSTLGSNLGTAGKRLLPKFF
jgi:hypothetical protein